MKTDVSQTSGFEAFVTFLAVASLVGSLLAASYIIPSIRPGFYGGTALMVFFLAIVQSLALIAGAGLPVLVMAIRRKLRLSRGTCLLLSAAVGGVLLEIAALCLIRVTGSS